MGEGLEQILKGLQKINKQLRYQVHLGSKDLEVMIKNHHDYDYKPYRKIDIKSIDPNRDVPEWDLVTPEHKKNERTANSTDTSNDNGKREASSSPEGHRSKRSNLDTWQVQEFVWAFLEGMATTPNYTNLTWEMEENPEVLDKENDLDAEKNEDEEIETEASLTEGEED